MSEPARVLIIEDDADAAEVMKVSLKSQGYSVVVATDPQQGYAQARECKPGVIILDVMFGKGEQAVGFEWAVKFRQDAALAAVPILMVTAVNIKHPGFRFSPETDQEYLPVDDFVDKPAQPQELLRKVQALLKMKTSKWKDWPRKPQ